MPRPDHAPDRAVLAHELANALAIVGGHAQLLQRQARRGAPLDPAVVLLRATTISNHCRRLAGLLAALREEWDATVDHHPRDGG